jgi:hypothetical protein
MTMSPLWKVEKSPTSTAPMARPTGWRWKPAGPPRVGAAVQVVREDAGGGIAAGAADQAVVLAAVEAAGPSRH